MKRSKKKGFTLVEIMIVVGIISILLLIAVPSWRQVRQTSTERACGGNRQRLDKAKTLWAADEGLDNSAVATPADLAPKYIKDFPVCPSNGVYSIGDGTTPAACSIHGSGNFSAGP